MNEKSMYIIIGMNYLKNYGSTKRGINLCNFHM